MEAELLKQIVKNTEPKSSFPITLRSKKTDFTTNFNPPIELDDDKDYEIALTGFETYNSTPNISMKNNILCYKEKGDWEKIVIPVGSYEVRQLNLTVNDLFQKKGYGKVVTFTPNLSTLKCEMTIEEGFQINFKKLRSLRLVLGFKKSIYPTGFHVADNPININNISSIYINIDIIKGSYVNGILKPVVYSFFPNVSPGYKIVQKPRVLEYLPVWQKLINSIHIKVTDQDFDELNLRGEEVTLRFSIREK